VSSVQVRIAYRPLRIGWAIRAGDLSALRSAVSVSFALWGGTFNPIIAVDKPALAENLIDQFRVDVICPIGDSDEVKSFSKRFPHLISPFLPDSIFVNDGDGGARSQALDVHNALVHLRDDPDFVKCEIAVCAFTIGNQTTH
jgi:hypothetical protein